MANTGRWPGYEGHHTFSEPWLSLFYPPDLRNSPGEQRFWRETALQAIAQYEAGMYRADGVKSARYIVPWRIMTPLMACNTLTSNPALAPRLAFYRYAHLFAEIEDIMIAKGAPIHRLYTGGQIGVAHH